MPNGFNNVIIYPKEYNDKVIFEVTFGSRITWVEETVYQFTRGLSGYMQHSNTTIISYGNFHDKNFYRMSATSTEECLFVAEEIEAFFDDRGIPYLDKLNDVQYLDRVINSKPNNKSPLFFNQQWRCFRGLAIAKLSGNTEFSILTKAYADHLEILGATSQTKRQFRLLAQYLGTYSIN